MEKPVQVFELTEDEWNAAVNKHLQKLGVTREQLKEKHDAGTLNAQEFKAWMLL